ncbi:PAS domain-containing protein, partial [Roseisolibacter sp. H3M3-2]|nr:PAS domain-containing protein [Roseisolibacter sp. H3M3-2]
MVGPLAGPPPYPPDDEPRRGRLTDPGRLAALRATGLLDGVTNPVLDRLAALAARLLGGTGAVVSLVDDRRQHLPGAAGQCAPAGAPRGNPVSHSFCRHVVDSAAPLVVGDARRHAVVAGNPAVAAQGIVAYLGVPLATADGDVLGALAVVDGRPRAWGEDDLATLADLAAAALSEIALRVQEWRFRLAVEASQEVIYAHDCLTGHVTREGAVEAVYGRRAGALPPDSSAWLALILPEDRARVADGWRAALAGEVSHWTCEYRIAHPDGRVVVVRDAARILRDADGAPQRIAGAVTDVTTQRVAEEALRASEEQARGVLEAAHEGICTVDAAGTITYANARLGEMLGVAAGSLGGASFFDLLDAATADAERARFERRRGGAAERVELPMRRADGSTLWASKSASTLRDGAGAFAGALFLFTDVTARRRAEERFERAVEATDDALWDWDLAADAAYFSPRWGRMLGYPGDADAPSWAAAVHPDDLPAVRAGLRAHVRAEAPHHAAEYRVRHR